MVSDGEGEESPRSGKESASLLAKRAGGRRSKKGNGRPGGPLKGQKDEIEEELLIRERTEELRAVNSTGGVEDTQVPSPTSSQLIF